MKCLSLAILVLAAIGAAHASPAPSPCPGETTVDMRACAARSLNQSNAQLQRKLPRTVFLQWQEATRTACARAYTGNQGGTLYPQLLISCDDQLNRALLKQFQPLVP